jgi:hypothetical protein
MDEDSQQAQGQGASQGKEPRRATLLGHGHGHGTIQDPGSAAIFASCARGGKKKKKINHDYV